MNHKPPTTISSTVWQALSFWDVASVKMAEVVGGGGEGGGEEEEEGGGGGAAADPKYVEVEGGGWEVLGKNVMSDDEPYMNLVQVCKRTPNY